MKEIKRNKWFILTILILIGIGLGAEIFYLNSQKQSKNSDFSFFEIGSGNLTYENDFSQLDRSLVNWPITFKECVDQLGTGAVKTEGSNTKYLTCSGDQTTHYFYKDTEDLDTLHLKLEQNTYSPNHEYNALISTVLQNINIPIPEQNSLIESFAIKPSDRKFKKPKIKHQNPDFIRDRPREKPQITLSGAFAKDFEVKWKNNGLWIRKTSARKDEPNLHFSDKQGKSVEVGDLRNPENPDKYKDIPLQKINQIVAKNFGKNQIFSLFTENRSNINPETGEASKTPYLEISIDKIAYQDLGFDAEFCQGNICFPDQAARHYKNRYYQYQEGDEAKGIPTVYFLYNSKLHLMIKREVHFMTSILFRENENSAYTLSSYSEESCGPSTLSQTITKGTENIKVAKNLTLFGENYTLQDSNFLQNYNVDVSNQYGFLTKIDKVFVSPAQAESYITQMIKDDLIIYSNYLITFAQYPNLTFIYSNTSRKINPTAVYHNSKPLMQNQSGDITSLTQTKDIYCNLGFYEFGKSFCPAHLQDVRNKNLGGSLFFSEEKERKAGKPEFRSSDVEIPLTKNRLPLFRIKKSNLDGYYFVFASDGVDFSNGGYGCKPVVYTYDQLERDNELTVTLPPQSRFTKLIPYFTTGQTWEFSTDKLSTISVKNQTFPYLYYSTLRKEYKNNKHGRTVKYDDIEQFLSQKLDAMNFNQKEKADFLEYWLPEFQPGFIYSISFKFNEEFAPYAQLDFKIKPEKIFRVFMEAHQRPLSTPISYDPSSPTQNNNKYLQIFDRGSTFDVLEWGGKIEKIRK